MALITVAIVAGTLLPYLNARDRRLLKPAHEEEEAADEDDEDDADMERIRELVRQWKAEAARHGRPLKLPRSEWATWAPADPAVPFMLRNIWTAGLALFGLVMMSTFFIQTVWQVCGRGCAVRNLTSGHHRDRVGRDLLGYRLLGVSRDAWGLAPLTVSPFA
jgi:hypothetical protein